jgi:hypothetical protein
MSLRPSRALAGAPKQIVAISRSTNRWYGLRTRARSLPSGVPALWTI